MALLTHSEALAFNGFLSSIDFGDALEWSGISPERLPLMPDQGKEALAKATKDLMSLEPSSHGTDTETSSQVRSSHGGVSSWPSFQADAADRKQQQHYTYGFPLPSSSSPSSSSRQSRRSTVSSTDRRRSPPDDIFHIPRTHSPRSHEASGSPSSAFADPQTPGSRTGTFAASTAPALLHRSSSSSKRSLPDGDWPGGAGASAKRRRPSVASPRAGTPLDDAAYASGRPRMTRTSSTSSSATAVATTTGGETSTGVKPALLSPSQKRANHIQSEQKRRANIRKGYDALCEVVPALRDAIRAEEEKGASEACRLLGALCADLAAFCSAGRRGGQSETEEEGQGGRRGR